MKKYIILLIFPILIILIAWNFYFKTPINYEYEGISFYDNDNAYKRVLLHVTGFRMSNIIRADYHKIKISIDGKIYPEIDIYEHILPFKFRQREKVPTDFEASNYFEYKIIEFNNYTLTPLSIIDYD